MKSFVGINDSENSIIAYKKAISILDKDIDRYYSDANNSKHANDESNPESDSIKITDVDVPLQFYQSMIVSNIRPKIYNRGFRGKYMQRVHENFVVIQKLMLEENRSAQYVAKWLRIPPKTFYKCFLKYFRDYRHKQSEVEQLYDIKYQRLENIKGLVELYLNCNVGRCVTTKSILDFIQTGNIGDDSKPFTYDEVRH